MRFRGKSFLFGLLLIIMTIGGVFASWVFDIGNKETEGSAGVGVIPEYKWEFDEVGLKFCADTVDENGEIIKNGVFSNGDNIVSVNNSKGHCIDDSIIPSNPLVENDLENQYAFAYWYYFKDGNQHILNYDIQVYDDETYYAMYVETSNPVLKKVYYEEPRRYETVGYMFQNPEKDYEYMYVNLEVNDEIGIDETYRGYGYCVVDGQNIISCCDTNSTDYVVKGTYTVYYRSTLQGDETSFWEKYGNKCYFQRQYRFALMGNPNNGWDFNEDTPTFGYVGKTNEGEKEYHLDNVCFNDTWKNNGSTVSYAFKPFEYSFNIWPSLDGSPILEFGEDDANDYFSITTSGSNLVLNSIKHRVFDLRLYVSFIDDDSRGCEYPNEVRIVLTVDKYNISFYNEDKTTLFRTGYAPVGEIYGSDAYSSYPTPSSLTSNQRVKNVIWKDIDTDEVVDFNSKSIEENIFVYPEFVIGELKNITLYFYNESKWTANSIYCYSWSDDNYLYTGSYPGVKMTALTHTDALWYYVTIKVDNDDSSHNVIFNNGGKDSANQSPDLIATSTNRFFRYNSSSLSSSAHSSIENLNNSVANSSNSLAGTMNSWSTTSNYLKVGSGNYTVLTVYLDARTYEFKIVENGSSWYGNNGTIADTTTKTSSVGWDMYTSHGNCKLSASGGYYSFVYDWYAHKIFIYYRSSLPG